MRDVGVLECECVWALMGSVLQSVPDVFSALMYFSATGDCRMPQVTHACSHTFMHSQLRSVAVSLSCRSERQSGGQMQTWKKEEEHRYKERKRLKGQENKNYRTLCDFVLRTFF